ncbi:hypothetical protein D3C72_1885740 [compost metagenome]
MHGQQGKGQRLEAQQAGIGGRVAELEAGRIEHAREHEVQHETEAARGQRRLLEVALRMDGVFPSFEQVRIEFVSEHLAVLPAYRVQQLAQL